MGPLFLVFVAFLASFAFIRTSARLSRSPKVPWWPGSVVEGGVHLHHLVWGIWLMLVGGAIAFAVEDRSPGVEICAVAFGIGAGLTIDEFALWVYLKDVYWTREGRSSIDAAVIAASAMALVLLGARPFEAADDATELALTLATIGVLVAFALVCLAKLRVYHCVVGIFIWPVSVYGAVRLGKPGSPWAKRLYGERNPRKQARAVDRFGPDRRTERFKERLRDLLGGRTDDAYRSSST